MLWFLLLLVLVICLALYMKPEWRAKIMIYGGDDDDNIVSYQGGDDDDDFDAY